MRRYLFAGVVVAIGLLGVPIASANHSGNTYNCDDFGTKAELQAHVNAHPGDQDNLDSDNDGISCESSFGGGVRVQGAGAGNLATTAVKTRSLEVLGLSALLLGMLLRMAIRKPAKHRVAG